MPTLLSELNFCAYLVYSPRGQSDVSIKSRQIRDAVKAARTEVIQPAISQLKTALTLTAAAFFGNDVILIPAPGSSPLVTGAAWPALTIAKTLESNGLGHETVKCLRRTTAVPKSAYASPGNRPSVQRHYDTMEVDAQLLSAKRILLVDDFVTKGATLLAGASRIAEAFPTADIRAFALVRTRGLVQDIDNIPDLAVGQITYSGGDVQRNP